jgi:hypothetical protein
MGWIVGIVIEKGVLWFCDFVDVNVIPPAFGAFWFSSYSYRYSTLIFDVIKLLCDISVGIL